MVEGVILVVDTGKTMRRDLRRAREAIEAVGGKVLGVVINRLDPHGGSMYYAHRYGYALEAEVTTSQPGWMSGFAAQITRLMTTLRPSQSHADPTVERPLLKVDDVPASPEQPVDGFSSGTDLSAADDAAPRSGRGRPARIGPMHYAALESQLAARPDATLAEHVELWERSQGVRVSVATMDRSIARLGWTRSGGRWVPPAAIASGAAE
jgi:hypothetical protein